MADKAKKKQVEEIAKKFVGLDKENKAYITGYMNGVHEERQKWERKAKVTASA